MLLQFALLATKNQNQRATPHLYCNNNKAAANNKQHLQKRKSGQIKTFCSANNVKMESCKNIQNVAQQNRSANFNASSERKSRNNCELQSPVTACHNFCLFRFRAYLSFMYLSLLFFHTYTHTNTHTLVKALFKFQFISIIAPIERILLYLLDIRTHTHIHMHTYRDYLLHACG